MESAADGDTVPLPLKAHPPFIGTTLPLHWELWTLATVRHLEDTMATYDGDVIRDHEQLLDELMGRHVGRGQLRPLILQHVQQAAAVDHVRHVALQ